MPPTTQNGAEGAIPAPSEGNLRSSDSPSDNKSRHATQAQARDTALAVAYARARPSLTIMTWRCAETHRIGRNRPKREKANTEVSVAAGETYRSPRSAPAGRLPGSGEFDDPIPFAPEVR